MRKTKYHFLLTVKQFNKLGVLATWIRIHLGKWRRETEENEFRREKEENEFRREKEDKKRWR